MAKPASDVTAIHNIAESAWAAPSRESIFFPERTLKSTAAKISRFIRLLPRRSPAARSTKPERIAAISTDNSGSDVTPAKSKLPTRSRPSPVASAIRSADRASNDPAIATAPASNTNCPTSKTGILFLSEPKVIHVIQAWSHSWALVSLPKRHELICLSTNVSITEWLREDKTSNKASYVCWISNSSSCIRKT